MRLLKWIKARLSQSPTNGIAGGACKQQMWQKWVAQETQQQQKRRGGKKTSRKWCHAKGTISSACPCHTIQHITCQRRPGMASRSTVRLGE
jgi:hypothetical protein